MELNSKYGIIKIFTEQVESEALTQIIKMGNSPTGENANIRIMPDCHAGKACTVGTTMRVTDKICPNLIGGDIGCGVDLITIREDITLRLQELDSVIRKSIPHGFAVHENLRQYSFDNMHCWRELKDNAKKRSQYSLGSLGGGNHFIEGYKNAISVHSGSRNIGQAVANYYQRLANRSRKSGEVYDPQLSYLTGQHMDNCLDDMRIVQQFAADNRQKMLQAIAEGLNLTVTGKITSTHNYIDMKSRILRKGAISAAKGERLVIPLNMRDAMLLCRGKGNEDWNFSAPHGAGRLYSRKEARELFTLEAYQKAMEGIYTTCVHGSTLDESPFAYKDYREIMSAISETVEIVERLGVNFY